MCSGVTLTFPYCFREQMAVKHTGGLYTLSGKQGDLSEPASYLCHVPAFPAAVGLI